MKENRIMTVLAFACSPAFAGWTMLQGTRDGILCVDCDSAGKTGHGWQVGSSQDFHRLQRFEGREYLSVRSRHELDCSANKLRTLSVELFPKIWPAAAPCMPSAGPATGQPRKPAACWRPSGKAFAVDRFAGESDFSQNLQFDCSVSEQSDSADCFLHSTEFG